MKITTIRPERSWTRFCLFVVAIVAAGCEEKVNRADTELKAQEQSAWVNHAHVNTWYQTVAALKRHHNKSSDELEEALNVAIVENYLPLYLQQSREGQVNESHLKVAKSAYLSISEKKRADLPLAKVVSEESLQSMGGILESLGYVKDDLSSAERFNALRRAYLDTLGAQ